MFAALHKVIAQVPPLGVDVILDLNHAIGRAASTNELHCPVGCEAAGYLGWLARHLNQIHNSPHARGKVVAVKAACYNGSDRCGLSKLSLGCGEHPGSEQKATSSTFKDNQANVPITNLSPWLRIAEANLQRPLRSYYTARQPELIIGSCQLWLFAEKAIVPRRGGGGPKRVMTTL